MVNGEDFLDGSTPNLFKLVKEYCRLATLLEFSQEDARRIVALSELAACDRALNYWFEQANCLIEHQLSAGKQPDYDFIVNFLSIQDFIGKLVQVSPERDVTLEKFEALVADIQLTDRFLSQYISFNDRYFSRKLIFQTRVCTIYTIAWKPGQVSDVHHHGGALDAIRVYQGKLAHWLFGKNRPPTPQEIRSKKAEQFGQNELILIDRYQSHRTGNTSDENLITLNFRFGAPPDDRNWEKEFDERVAIQCKLNEKTERISCVMPVFYPN